MRVLYSALIIGVCLLIGNNEAYASPLRWEAWKKELQVDLVSKGIDESLASSVLRDLAFDPKVLEHDQSQPSSRMSFAAYQKRAVNQGRIDRGRAFYRRYRFDIERISEDYGVPGPVIVALLGIETDYGGYTGSFDVIRSMASLAFGAKRDTKEATEKRRELFYNELYYAFKMIQDGIRTRDNLIGSWAGAVGINQHMPSSYYAKVVDGDNDGDRDIWDMDDLSDVFATTASHLKSVGWRSGEKWGRAVEVPDDLSQDLIGNKIKKPLSFWRDAGIKTGSGAPLPVVAGMNGSLIAPDGLSGPVFIGYENFHAFRRWNRSDYFALVVGQLADEIAKTR